MASAPVPQLEVDTRALRVVVVDARAERRLLIRRLVEATGLSAPEIGEAGNRADAVELLGSLDPDIAVLEIQPLAEGLETILALRERSPLLRIVVCSFLGDAAAKELARARGADVYLDKPISSDTLRALFLDLAPGRLDAASPSAGTAR